MRSAKLFLIVLLAGLITACGFQLRGSSYALKMNSITLSLSPSSELYGLLKQKIESSGTTRVVTSTKDAEAILSVLGDTSDKSILSLTAAGRASEYQVSRTFSFKLEAPNGDVFIPPSQIKVQRTFTFNDNLVLAKESEEALLQRDMQDDLVRQIMRRLASVKMKRLATADTPVK